MNIDAGAKRFLSLLLAPVFLLLKNKLGLDVPESVQDLLVVSVITYVGGSHFKEAVVRKAEASGVAAAAAVTPESAPGIIRGAAGVEEPKQ